MKMLYDFFTIVVFFVVYKFYGFYYATAVINILLCVSVVAYRVKYGHFDKMQTGIFLSVLLLSIPTFLLHEEIFFKWKPSVISWAFAIALLVMRWIGDKKTLLQRALEKEKIFLPAAVLTRINYIWIAYFIAIGAINLYVAYQFSTDIWVNFKLFGTLGSSICLLLVTFAYLFPHIKRAHEHGQ